MNNHSRQPDARALVPSIVTTSTPDGPRRRAANETLAMYCTYVVMLLDVGVCVESEFPFQMVVDGQHVFVHRIHRRGNAIDA